MCRRLTARDCMPTGWLHSRELPPIHQPYGSEEESRWERREKRGAMGDRPSEATHEADGGVAVGTRRR
jgi:hypothetical protein